MLVCGQVGVSPSFPLSIFASPGATRNDAVNCADVITPFYFIFYIFIIFKKIFPITPIL